MSTTRYDGFLPVSDNYDTSFMDEDIETDDEVNENVGHEEDIEWDDDLDYPYTDDDIYIDYSDVY